MPSTLARTALRLSFALLLAAACALPAQAQRFEQYARAEFPSSQVLGMGGAGVAFAGAETAFFYNPAHFATIGRRPRIEILGVRAEASTKIFDDLDFFRDRVEPAIESGIELPLTQESRDLFVDAFAQGLRPTVGQVGVLAPSLMVKAGPVGIGAGAFANTTTRYRFEDDGGGIPIIDLFGQGDAMGLIGFGAAIPGSNLSAGLTGKYVRRFVGFKNEDLLSIDPDDEQIYIIDGSTVTFDAGLQYTDAFALLPGSLDFGLAVYDIVGGAFDYELFDNIDLTEGANEGSDDEPNDPEEVAEILEVFQDRDGSPSFRVGAAYSVPALQSFPLVRDVGVALDYVSQNTSESDQPFLSKFRLGGQATLAGILAVRAGVSQGYPTVGAGLQTPFFRMDYVFYGIEDGRLPGQIERYNHFVQLRVGLF